MLDKYMISKLYQKCMFIIVQPTKKMNKYFTRKLLLLMNIYNVNFSFFFFISISLIEFSLMLDHSFSIYDVMKNLVMCNLAWIMIRYQTKPVEFLIPISNSVVTVTFKLSCSVKYYQQITGINYSNVSTEFYKQSASELASVRCRQ